MRLLVSVVTADEARDAVCGGADILDVKNPAEGSLGAQFPRVIQEIRATAPRPLKVSVAIGDMPNLPGTASLAALGAAVCGADYVKVGLLGPRAEADAVFLLREVRRAVSDFSAVDVIAGGYADARRTGTLDPRLLPRIAREAGVAGCLVDTAIKDGHRLFDFLTPEELHAMAAEVHSAGLLLALAGALREQDLLLVRDLGADVVGVRTAVCRDGHRAGPLEVERVRRLREIIASPDDAARKDFHVPY